MGNENDGVNPAEKKDQRILFLRKAQSAPGTSETRQIMPPAREPDPMAAVACRKSFWRK